MQIKHISKASASRLTHAFRAFTMDYQSDLVKYTWSFVYMESREAVTQSVATLIINQGCSANILSDV